MLRGAIRGPHKPRPATATDKAGGVDPIRLVRRRDLTRAFWGQNSICWLPLIAEMGGERTGSFEFES